MEGTESPEDASAMSLDAPRIEMVDSNLEPEDEDMSQLTADGFEPMEDETEAARIDEDAVMEQSHAEEQPEESAIEVDRGEEEEEEEESQGKGEEAVVPQEDQAMAEAEDGNTRDTLPMYDEEGGGSEDAVSSAETTETKDPSPSTEGESSIQSLPETSEELPANLPSTFPHCFICGFDRETVLCREKKAVGGQYRNHTIHRNKCVRKMCARYFGPSYLWEAAAGEYVKIMEETSASSRPFADAPRTCKRFPDSDYARAGDSGVRHPEDSSVWLRLSPRPPPPVRVAVAAAAAAAGTSGSSSCSSGSPAAGGTASPAASASPAPPKKSLSASAAAAAARKPRKGYQWVEEKDEGRAPAKDPVMEMARMYAAQAEAEAAIEKAKIKRATIGCQTGDDDHLQSFVVDEMRAKASYKGLRRDETMQLPAAVSNKLFLAQKTLVRQMRENKQLIAERKTLREALKKSAAILVTFRQDVMSDMQRLKDDVSMANKELKNFGLEMQGEATKDIKDIKKLKEHVAKRIDDTDRYRRKIEASLEYQQSQTKQAQLLADEYHRASVELDLKVTNARREAEDAKEKLNDKIYLTNNAKCAHCQVNARIKEMLTEQIAEKTMSATNLGKERAALARKLENSERIATIVSKENQRLKFELRAWEMNCHRMKGELQTLRSGHAPQGLVTLPAGSTAAALTPSSSSSSGGSSGSSGGNLGEAAFTPQSTTTTKDAEEVSPERGDDVLVVEDGEAPLDRPPPASSVSSEEGEYKSPSPNTLARLPPPPAPPACLKDPSPEHDAAFASWIPKERKAPEMPEEMLAAMRKVGEALDKGPPPPSQLQTPQHQKKERKEEKGAAPGGAGAKRSAGQVFSQHKNGEKKPKREGGGGAKEAPPPPRPIPSLGSASSRGGGGTNGGLAPGVLQKMAEKEKEKRRRAAEEAAPVPYASVHEPAFPAVVVAKKAAPLKVPYNGPSSLSHSNSPSTSSASQSPLPGGKHAKAGPAAGSPEKKPLSFLPVAGATGLLPLREPSSSSARPAPLPVDAILREAERLRDIERERELRREMELRQRIRPADAPFYDHHHLAPPHPADRRPLPPPQQHLRPGPARLDFGFDDDLPWNQAAARGGIPPPVSYQTTRPRTPTQDWYYDAHTATGGPHPPPAAAAARGAPSPSRFFDDTYDPRAPRDQYGRLEPDFGALRQHQHLRPQPQLQPHHPGLPLGHPARGGGGGGGPPPGDVWRRDWHAEPNWSDEGPPHPQRRTYWE